MPPADFYIKENDTSPDFQVTLKDGDNAAVDVSGATIKFSMKNISTGVVKVSTGSVTLVTAASGIVKYVWSAVDTDTPGTYLAEFEVTFADATVQTYSSNKANALYVHILAEIA